MTSGQFFAENVYNMMESEGSDVTYRQMFVINRDLNNQTRTNTTMDKTVKAHFRTRRDRQQAGAVHQYIRECRIAALALGFRPRQGDIIIEGEGDFKSEFKVESVDPRRHGGVDVMYIMTVQGGDI